MNDDGFARAASSGNNLIDLLAEGRRSDLPISFYDATGQLFCPVPCVVTMVKMY